MSARVSQMAGWRKGFRGCSQGPGDTDGTSDYDQGRWRHWEGWYPPHHSCAATRRQWRSTSHQRPNPDRYLSREFSGVGVVPALQHPCLRQGSNQRLSQSTGHDLTTKWQQRQLSGGWVALAGTVRARCLVPTGTGWMTPDFSDIEQWTQSSVGARKSQRQFW